MIYEQLCYCVLHSLICGALFLVSGSMASAKPEQQRHSSRILYMTFLMIAYHEVLIGASPPMGLARSASNRCLDEAAVLSASLSFVACASLGWWLLTIFVSIVSEIVGPQPRLQFHLLTVLLATMILGALVAANVDRTEQSLPGMTRDSHGWPVSFVQSEKHTTGVRTVVQFHRLLPNLVVWTLIVSVPVLICEWCCRRRDEISRLQERNRQRERDKERVYRKQLNPKTTRIP